MKHYKMLIILFSFMLFIFPASSYASGNLKTAKKFFKTAQALFGAGEYKKAADNFMKAYKAKSIPAFLFNAAVCFEKIEKYEQAKKYFVEYLSTAKKVRNLYALQARIRLLGKLIKYKQLKIAQKLKQQQQVKTDKTSANTQKTDKKTDKTPANTQKTDKKTDKTPANTQKTDKKTDKKTKKQKNKVKIILMKKPVLPPISTQNITTINTDPPGAAIYLSTKNNKKELIGHTPYEGNIEPGKYIMELTMPKYAPIKKVVEIPKDRVLELYFNLRKVNKLAWIQVTSNVPGSSVFLDKKSVGSIGKTPYSGFVTPGKHTLYVVKEGFKEKKLKINALIDKTNSFYLKLKNAPISYLTFYGKKAVGAKVKFAKKTICMTPCFKIKVPAGKHKLHIYKKDKKSIDKTLNLKIREHREYKLFLAKKPSKAGAIMAYIVGFASLGGAIWLGSQSEKLKDEIITDIDSGYPVFSNDQRINKGKLYAIGADVLYGFSALSFVVAVYKTFANSGKDSEITRTYTLGGGAVSLEPLLIPNGNGIALTFKY